MRQRERLILRLLAVIALALAAMELAEPWLFAGERFTFWRVLKIVLLGGVALAYLLAPAADGAE